MKTPGIIVVNRSKRNSTTDFVDMQVATLISDHESEELCIGELVKAAKRDMPNFDWTDDKIRNSLNRLQHRGRMQSKYVIRGKKLCRVPYPI